MAFRFNEDPSSRAITNVPPTFTYIYNAVGEQDQATVNGYALGATPLYVSLAGATLYRQDVKVVPVGFEIYQVTVPYGERKRETGSYTFNFDTTGGTATIKCAKEHINSYPAAGGGLTSNPHKSSIGVTDDSVEGAEIVIPALRLTVTYSHPYGEITLAQVRTLARYTGHWNANSFLGFDPGELLYTGSTGSDGSEAPAEIAYNFIASQNVTGLTFGDISGVAKKGHEYAWIEFKAAEDSGNAATQPLRVHVERVYDSADFATVFGWS